ncbi:hypothetical protein PIB30_024402 [Stylosanthes scabra]|uniref:AUGMIN subunit 8 n=1 Tax=Stylosanthes scabra TaxID=79078 RepID=A0ABU6T9G4_9FABA|nr:hypothetical protein [Stylosanthes scabra]
MDVCESKQGSSRRQQHKSDNNAPATRRSTTRQVTSRYNSPSPLATRDLTSRHRSPSPSPASSSRRFPSPNPTKASSRPKYSESKRPSTPPSPPQPPPRPSTPVRDSSLDFKLSSRRAAAAATAAAGGSRLPESLWPSTMRSLSVSFQSDSVPIPVSKKSKPVTSLRPAHKQAETLPVRKPTPERKRSPLKVNHSENSKPIDTLPSKFIDPHRWPSRIRGKVSSMALNRSVDLAATSDVISKPLRRASSEAITLFPRVGSGNTRAEVKSGDDFPPQQVLRQQKSLPVTPSGKSGAGFTGVRSRSLPVPGSQSHSGLPNRNSVLSSSSSRGMSPCRSRPSTPPPPRGVSVSPSRIRSSSSSSNSNSVLSFIADFRKGNKAAANLEDAHRLRLLYNRYLQWRFANARAEAALYIQNVIVERTLYDVWRTTLSLLESVIRSRIDLQQRKLELKLNSILNDEMTFLDDWAVFERDHGDALSGAVQDFKASTLCLPVAGGAKVDIEHLKAAICQAVDVMQAMGSTICSLLLRVEGMNNLISEVAIVAAKEKAMLDECELLLASVAAIQVEESSVRTHLMQIKLALGMSK